MRMNPTVENSTELVHNVDRVTVGRGNLITESLPRFFREFPEARCYTFNGGDVLIMWSGTGGVVVNVPLGQATLAHKFEAAGVPDGWQALDRYEWFNAIKN